MKDYKDFEKEHIGSSDIATLILAGFKEGKGVLLQTLHFGEDGNYEAYIVEGKDVKIGNHYSKIEEYDTWMKIYDDDELVRTFKADRIVVYRAAEMGCIIQLINEED